MTGPSDALVAALLLSVATLSGLPVPSDARPHVTLTRSFEGSSLCLRCPYQGATSRRTGHIALHETWRPDGDGICTLEHELVHYLQFVNGVLGSAADNEPMAYMVMARCYDQQGMPIDARLARTRAADYAAEYVRMKDR